MLFWVCLFVCIQMVIAMTLIMGGALTVTGFLRDVGIATAVAYAAGLLIPVSKWADRFALACKAKPGSLAFTLLSNLILTLFNGTLMTALFTAMAIGFPPYFFTAFLSTLPTGLIVGYFAGLIAGFAAMKVSQAMCVKD